MNSIEKMIQDQCPNGVEYDNLEKFATLSRGKVYSKSYLAHNKGDYPVYSSQTANNGELGRISTYDYDGEYLTWTTDGAYAGTIFHRKGKFSITNVCGLISVNNPKITIRFLYYWLSIEAPKHVYSGMGNPKLMSNQMSSISVPVPPLEIQEEVVRILDKFTDFKSDLETELEGRKQQYEYYHEYLFKSIRNKCKQFTLKDVCNKTSKIKWKNDTNSYKYIDLSAVDRESSRITDTIEIDANTAPSRAQQIVFTNDIIYGTTRPTLKRYCIISNEYNNSICSTGFCVLRPNTDLILPRFLYYTIQTTEFNKYIENNQEGAGYPSIKNSKLLDFEIDLPPVDEQERIVSILDNFDLLIKDKGIPDELSLLQQQYEYYRDKLLTFKRRE